MTANPDDELLALEAKLVDEYATMEVKKGKTDDEVDEWTARLDILEQQFADMPAHTLNGVAAKLRRAEEWTGEGCTGDWGEQLVRQARETVERLIGRVP